VGNPFLRPQFTNVFEVGYGVSWTGGSVTTALYHRDIRDSFLRVFAIDDSNQHYDIVNRIFENAADSAQTGIQVLAEQTIASPWRVSGSVNWYQNEIDPLATELLFPTRRPFFLPGSTDGTWDATVNNRFVLPRAIELQANYIYYAQRNIPQGVQRPRSSVDLSTTWPIVNDRAELQFTFTDIFNDFAVEQEIAGEGFDALYQNFLETQVATLTLRVRF
jgi:outer membrane receptor protein involved in Fe transport